jgi:hypothetical protein
MWNCKRVRSNRWEEMRARVVISNGRVKVQGVGKVTNQKKGRRRRETGDFWAASQELDVVKKWPKEYRWESGRTNEKGGGEMEA